MQLFWSSRSPYARKVTITAIELGLMDRIELLPVVVTLRTREPRVVKANPLGQIPTLVTDMGEALFGSVVICEYLSTLAPSDTLYPAARIDALARQAIGDGMLDALMRWYSERSRTGDPKSAEYIEVARAKLLNSVAYLEARTPALFDIGTVAVCCALGYADFRFAEFDWRAGHPMITRWYDEIATRPSFLATAHVG